MAAVVDAGPYRVGGPQRPTVPVRRAGFYHAQTLQQADCVAGCDAPCTADYGCPDTACGDAACDPWCGCGPCGCPDLIGGLIRHIGLSIHWLLCCDHCGTYCGGTCCDPCYESDACYDSCGAGTAEEGTIDLVPTPSEPAPRQGNPFKDDTVSVVPRQARAGRDRAHRAYLGRPSAVIRSAYDEPIERLPRSGVSNRNAGRPADATAPRSAASDAPARRLQRTKPLVAKPPVAKAAILESLRQAIE
ncbi:MAG: hypothetical protein A2W31_11250 [Planctomycetes bacterium RBG_16_64_10]|nr:MAG: hypothetical protein A2W31_11250 [Planctomycetes bacterium RBG_16_64_10]